MEENQSLPWISGPRTETGTLAGWEGLEHEGIWTEDIAQGPQKVLASQQERRGRGLGQDNSHSHPLARQPVGKSTVLYKDSSQQKSGPSLTLLKGSTTQT